MSQKMKPYRFSTLSEINSKNSSQKPKMYLRATEDPSHDVEFINNDRNQSIGRYYKDYTDREFDHTKLNVKLNNNPKPITMV